MKPRHFLLQSLTVLLLVCNMPLLLSAQKNCERIVACSDISLPPFLTDSIFKQASKCYINYIILNSLGSNNFFQLRILPVKEIQSTEAAPYDYGISGSMSYLRGRYNIELKLTANNGQLLATGRSSCTKPEEICQTASNAAMSMGAIDSVVTPLISTITNFELKTRELLPGVALCPSMRFIDGSATVQLKPFERKQLKLEVSDADGVKIKGMKIQVKCSEGTLVQGTVLTDKDGIATIDLFAPFEETTYRVGALGEVTYPSRRQGQIDPEPFDILVKVKEPVTRLLAMIEVTKQSETWEESYDGKIHGKGTSHYSNQLTLNIARGRIEYLQKPENWSNIMNTGVQYEILTGLTSRDENGEPVPITASGSSEIKKTENGKTRLEERSSFEAETNGWDIYLAIHPYNPMAGNEQVASLTRSYALIFKGVGNMRMYPRPSKYGSKGNVNGVRRNSDDELESFSEEANIGAPGFSGREPINNEVEQLKPLVINEYQELEKYLLEPKGTFVLSLNGSWAHEVNSFKNEVKVKLTMWPDTSQE